MRPCERIFDEMLSILLFIVFRTSAVSRKDIEENVSSSCERTIQRYLKDLQKLSFIEVLHQGRKGVTYLPTLKAKQMFGGKT